MKNKVLFCAVLLFVLLFCCSCAGKDQVIRVYAPQGILPEEVISLYEKESKNEIFLVTYDTDETMYSRMRNMKNYSFDVVITTDYMMDKLVDDSYLEEMDYGLIKNLDGVDSSYLNKNYDKKLVFTLPYAGATLCLAYNPNYVSESEVTSWNVLMNEKFTGHVGVIDSTRDGMGIGLLLGGYTVNSKLIAEIEPAVEILYDLEENECVFGNSNELMDRLISGELYLAAVISTSYEKALKSGSDIRLAIPDEGTRTITYVMAIPKNAGLYSKGADFINFLLRDDVSEMTCGLISSRSPVIGVREKLDTKITGNDVIYYPEGSEVSECISINDYYYTYIKYWTQAKKGRYDPSEAKVTPNVQDDESEKKDTSPGIPSK